MSCQQVPRVTEDPYVFTDSASSAPTLFNPQIHKLTSFISSPIPASEVQKTKFHVPKQKPIQARLITTSTAPVTQATSAANAFQASNNRINGTSVQLNGVHKIGLMAISNGKPKPIKVVQTPKKFVTWSGPTVATPTGTTTATAANTSPLSMNPSPLLPPSNFHKTTLSQHMQTFAHTPLPTSTIQAYVVPQQTPPKQKLAVSAAAQVVQQSPKQQNLQSVPTASPQQASEAAKSTENHSEINDINEIPVNVIYRNPSKGPAQVECASFGQGVKVSSQTVSANSKSISNPTQPQSTSSSSPKPLSKSTGKKRKSTASESAAQSAASADQGVFALPAKRDSRVLSSSAKKAFKAQTNSNTQASASAKTKRSYSQTAHHEALQRISRAAKSIAATAPSSTDDEWHAPDSFMFDCIVSRPAPKCDSFAATAPFVQSHWLNVDDLIGSSSSNFNREQRIEIRRGELRRQAMQLIKAQQFRTPFAARKRLVFVSKMLHKLKQYEDVDIVEKKTCCIPGCPHTALALTAHCYLHITRSTDQHLFLPCTAKYLDNTPCRSPVFNITHEPPLCQEHLWKHDNCQSIKPKKTPGRKRTKSNVIMTTAKAPKRVSKMKKKTKRNDEEEEEGVVGLQQELQMHSDIFYQHHEQLTHPLLQQQQSHVIHHHDISQRVPVSLASSTEFLSENTNTNDCGSIMDYDYKGESDEQHTISEFIPSSQFTILPQMKDGMLTHDMLGICENSSQYESSEDTGVGGLSESELMGGAHDVIEEIPLGDTTRLLEHDVLNVLNQLPVGDLNELFNTTVHEEEQEEVERALALADRQVKSLQQSFTCGDSTFLGDFLDVDDQILDDTDICSEVVLHSPDTSGIDTSTLFIDGGSNSTGSCITTTTATTTPSDLRGLVQT